MSRPSPSLVISIIALIVATAGTATAAGVFVVKNSSQVKPGAISGSDIKLKSLTNRTLASGSVDNRVLATAVKNQILAGAGATEAIRRDGPEVDNGGQAQVVAMPKVPPGQYLILAKMTMTPKIQQLGLGEILRNPKTGGGHCVLNAAGDVDDSRHPILTPESSTPSTMNMQITRSLNQVSDIVLLCDANIGWKATDASIIALKIGSATRVDDNNAIAPITIPSK